MPEIMTSEQLSAEFGGSPSTGTLRNWRYQGIGPKYVKVGASVRYRRSDVVAWLDSRTAGGNEAA